MRSPDVLRRQAEFQRLYRCGRFFYGDSLVLAVLHTEGDRCRVAIVASRKVGHAVRRNRAKRLLREAQRMVNRRHRPSGVDLALIARAPICQTKVMTVAEELERLYRLAGLAPEFLVPSEMET